MSSSVKVPKKRGRKPKGGKIITSESATKIETVTEPNIILHLKCNVSELNKDRVASSCNYENFQFEEDKTSEFHEINTNVSLDNNDINQKLLQLSMNLHTNNVSENKSACFWCTHDFDNPPIHIPSHEVNGSYHCYGCFCSPECAVAYLFKEEIDTTAQFERYHMINHLYCKIYNYETNVKPAPNPHYTLEKFYGNLNIQEYRKLLSNERLLLVIDKPLTRVLPELHEDNKTFLLNSNIIPSANQFTIRKHKQQSKSKIIANQFNVS